MKTKSVYRYQLQRTFEGCIAEEGTQYDQPYLMANFIEQLGLHQGQQKTARKNQNHHRRKSAMRFTDSMNFSILPSEQKTEVLLSSRLRQAETQIVNMSAIIEEGEREIQGMSLKMANNKAEILRLRNQIEQMKKVMDGGES